MMGVYPPTSGPTPITSLGKPSNGREVGKGVGWENLPTRWVTDPMSSWSLSMMVPFWSPSAHASTPSHDSFLDPTH